MGVKIETQVKNGKYPSKEVFEKYYIEENHTIGETASQFGLTKNIVLNLSNSIIKKTAVKLCLRGFDINNQMIFKQSKNNWKLVEYHPEIENILPGSTKYLFDFFVNNFTPQSIFCYCPFDRDNEQILEDVGMNFIRYTPPKKHKIIFHNVESVFYDSGGKYYEYKKEGRGK